MRGNHVFSTYSNRYFQRNVERNVEHTMCVRHSHDLLLHVICLVIELIIDRYSYRKKPKEMIA